MSDAPTVYSKTAATEEFVPYQAGVVSWLRRDDDVQAGTWACSVAEFPGVHEVELEIDETVLILAGRMKVEVDGGPTLEIGPGESASLAKGTVSRWTILEDVKEFFVLS